MPKKTVIITAGFSYVNFVNQMSIYWWCRFFEMNKGKSSGAKDDDCKTLE